MPGETPFQIRTRHADGTYTLEVFGAPVRYEDANGALQFIDTTMKKSTLTDSHAYENAANNFTVKYHKQANDGIQMNDAFTVSVPGAQSSLFSTKAKISRDENSDGLLTYPKAFGEHTYLEYINTSLGFKENIILEKNTGISWFEFKFDSDTHTPILSEDGTSIQIVRNDTPEQTDYNILPLWIYDSFKPGVDSPGQDGATAPVSETEAVSQTVPADERVSEAKEQTEPVDASASETLTAIEQTITEETSASIALAEENISQAADATALADASEVITEPSSEAETNWDAPKSTPTSAFRHTTEDARYELAKQDDGSYLITVVVSEEYLNHPETVYPVTIDPSIVVNATSSIYDTYVNEASPNTNYGSADRIRFGTSSGKRMFGYIKFAYLPMIPGSILSANVRVNLLSGTTSAYTCAMFRAQSAWTESGLTWNNQPYGTSPGRSSGHNNYSYYEFSATDLVKGWYSGLYVNNGVNFAYNPDEYYNDYNSVYSTEGNAALSPKLTITYTADQMVGDGIYYIRAKHSGHYLDADGSGNRKVVHFSFHGGYNQQWRVTYENDGYYTIETLGTGYQNTGYKMLSVSEPLDYVDLYYQDASLPTQRFLFIGSSEGSFSIVSKYKFLNGMPRDTLDVYQGLTSVPCDVSLWERHYGDNQRWFFEPVASEHTPSNPSQGFSATWPVNSSDSGAKTISSPFGYRTFDNSIHHGIDIPVKNKPVKAIMSGKIVYATTSSDSRGKYITIQHSNNMYSLYYHLSSIYVNVNDVVNQGQEIGISGDTGATGSYHLHLQVQFDYPVTKTKAINPLTFYHGDDKRGRERWVNPRALFIQGSDGAFVVNPAFNPVYIADNYTSKDGNAWK